MLRSCCVTRYLRRSAEADLFGERPSLCAVPDTWENRVSGTSAAFPRELTSLRGSMRVFFFSRAPAETANGASSWFAQTKDLWSPRTSHSRPQLFQSKWIGFAAPLAPGRIFTGGSWLKVAGASEPSVLLTPQYVQSVRGSARAQTTEIAKLGYFSNTSLESSATARFDLIRLSSLSIVSRLKSMAAKSPQKSWMRDVSVRNKLVVSGFCAVILGSTATRDTLQMAPAISTVAVNPGIYAAAPGGERRAGRVSKVRAVPKRGRSLPLETKRRISKTTKPRRRD